MRQFGPLVHVAVDDSQEGAVRTCEERGARALTDYPFRESTLDAARGNC